MAAWHASLLATWPPGFISITFFSTLVHEAICVTLLVSRSCRADTFIRRCLLEFSFDRSYLWHLASFWRPFRETDIEKPVSLPPHGYLIREKADSLLPAARE